MISWVKKYQLQAAIRLPATGRKSKS